MAALFLRSLCNQFAIKRREMRGESLASAPFEDYFSTMPLIELPDLVGLLTKVNAAKRVIA
jgi:hypothetical protein